MKTKILIIGAGLSGLHTAFELHKQGIDFLLVEARSRLGGRIASRHWQQTSYDENLPAYDMGPAWFWPGQTHLENLVHELDLAGQVFYQQESGDAIYENDKGHIQRGIQGISMAGSYRLQGGNAQIVASLKKQLPQNAVILDATITLIRQHESCLEAIISIKNQASAVQCERVIITAPPRVALKWITFEPRLSSSRVNVLNNIKTWMAGHAKLLALYETSFWLEQGFSGDCISQIGPMNEIHDASPKSGGPFALFGFMGVPAANRSEIDSLKASAIAQLVRLFGEQAADPLDIYFKDWARDDLTATELDQEMLTSHPSNDIQHNSEPGWNNRLIWSGTETSDGPYNGYLEGALEASVRTINLLAQNK